MFRVNDIFYSLQGEGRNVGRAAVFIRFAGCNLRCPFCDTEFDSFRDMTADEIMQAIAPFESRFVVLTGGEPTIQVDEAFVDLLHAYGYEVAMESNGTLPAPRNLDWLTVSPKRPLKEGWGSEAKRPDEIKIVFTSAEDIETICSSIELTSIGATLYLQPCDTGDAEQNRRIVASCVDYIKRHPEWRLSLQTHKLIGIE
ncbi:MAG: radical SAM protein [Prevotella sp.]|nr:radical SAM protein [Prevotella sp.]